MRTSIKRALAAQNRKQIRIGAWILPVFLPIFAIFISFAATVSATTLARLSLDQLAGAADAIARVRCTGAQSRWESGEIWTFASFDVVQTTKGVLPAHITVRLPGGRAGHLTAKVDGTPQFAAGEESVIFLEQSRAAGFSVAGWVEGNFRISRDPISGQENVTQDSSTFAVFDPATRAFRTEGVRHMPIEKFHALVESALARQKEKTK